MEQFEQSNEEQPSSHLARLAAAMLSCRLVSPEGCDARKSLCDDEFGVMTDCPGQMMRWVNRRDMTDE